MLERHVQEGAPRLGEELAPVPEVSVDVDPSTTALRHPGGDPKLPVDEHGPAIADEHPGGDHREAVPGAQEAARLVERRAHETPVDDPRPGLVALPEGEGRLVALDPLLRGEREVNAVRVVATPPTRRIVMGRDVYRRPPRSKCAL
jgi:hypothetical protein